MSQRQAAKALKVSQSTIRDDVSRKSSQLSRSHSTKAKRQRSNSGCDYDPHHVDASEPFDAMTANDDPLPCRHGRESVCRLNAGVVDDAEQDIEWRWRCQATPDCGRPCWPTRCRIFPRSPASSRSRSAIAVRWSRCAPRSFRAGGF